MQGEQAGESGRTSHSPLWRFGLALAAAVSAVAFLDPLHQSYVAWRARASFAQRETAFLLFGSSLPFLVGLLTAAIRRRPSLFFLGMIGSPIVFVLPFFGLALGRSIVSETIIPGALVAGIIIAIAASPRSSPSHEE